MNLSTKYNSPYKTWLLFIIAWGFRFESLSKVFSFAPLPVVLTRSNQCPQTFTRFQSQNNPGFGTFTSKQYHSFKTKGRNGLKSNSDDNVQLDPKQVRWMNFNPSENKSLFPYSFLINLQFPFCFHYCFHSLILRWGKYISGVCLFSFVTSNLKNSKQYQKKAYFFICSVMLWIRLILLIHFFFLVVFYHFFSGSFFCQFRNDYN